MNTDPPGPDPIDNRSGRPVPCPTFVGRIETVQCEPDGATLLSENARVRIRFLAEDFVRIRIDRRDGAEPDRSFAVNKTDWPPVSVSRVDLDGIFEIGAAAARVSVRKSDGAATVTDASGRAILRDAVVSFMDEGFTLAWTQPAERRVYACGEQAGPLDRRGEPMLFWNTDHYAYAVGGKPLYQSIPFCLGMDGPVAHGLLVDNTFRQAWDFGAPGETAARIEAAGGAADLYVFTGPDPKAVLSRYTELTGRMELPPLWALGYQQSRYSYYPEEELRAVAAEFRRRRIPCDVLYLDIHYMDAYKCFTWDRNRFPDPKRMLSSLGADGFRVITILDPGVKVEEGYPVYEELRAGGFYVKDPDGSPFVGPVWPGDCLFPDFTDPKCRAWWGGLYGRLLDDGVAAFWNDMNEPAVFETVSKTMPDTVRFSGDGYPGDHRRYHNVYGMQMARATYEGVKRLRPGERPFVLSRSAFAGSQRYGATWTGDNVATWDHLRVSIPMVLNLGLSGQGISGPDIGGFVGDPTPELFARWLQFGALMPFYRVHSARATHDVIQAEGSHPQEPWSWGEDFAAINRESIARRYRLLPYLYTLFEEMTRTGVPVMRPMFLEFPEDPACAGLDGQFMLGPDLLVAPILAEGATSRAVYLPEGNWYDYHTDERVPGGRTFAVEAPLDRLPLFVRAGSVLPTQAVVQHTGECADQPIVFRAYLEGNAAEGVVYEDDGRTMDCERGLYRRTRVHVLHCDGAPDIRTVIEGAYESPRPTPRYEIIGAA